MCVVCCRAVLRRHGVFTASRLPPDGQFCCTVWTHCRRRGRDFSETRGRRFFANVNTRAYYTAGPLSALGSTGTGRVSGRMGSGSERNPQWSESGLMSSLSDYYRFITHQTILLFNELLWSSRKLSAQVSSLLSTTTFASSHQKLSAYQCHMAFDQNSKMPKWRTLVFRNLVLWQV